MRAISRELVARCTPVINNRLPRSVASNSIASGMRAAAPVSATIPSALLSSVISSPAICETNHTKPPARMIAAVAPTAMVRNPIQRARPANMSVDHFKRVVDGLPRRQRRHSCDQHDLRKHGNIAKQGGCLIAAGSADKPPADRACQRKQDDCHAASDRSALQAEHQEMVLKMSRDEPVFR